MTKAGKVNVFNNVPFLPSLTSRFNGSPKKIVLPVIIASY
jgi:hypothetical protein